MQHDEAACMMALERLFQRFPIVRQQAIKHGRVELLSLARRALEEELALQLKPEFAVDLSHDVNHSCSHDLKV